MKNYDTLPHRLLDRIKDQLGLSTDVQLAETQQLDPPTISVMRKRQVLGPIYILTIHEATQIPIREIKTQLDMQMKTAAEIQLHLSNIRGGCR